MSPSRRSSFSRVQPLPHHQSCYISVAHSLHQSFPFLARAFLPWCAVYFLGCFFYLRGHCWSGSDILDEIRGIGESPELFLHRLREDRLYRREHRRDTRKLGIEVARIRRTLDGRLEWWSDSLVVDVVPIDVSEKWLAHDFLGIGWSTSQTLVRLASE